MFVDHVMKKKEEEERQLDKILKDINPFEAGLKCLEVHDIANAIVFFQAAVRKQPDHIDVRRIELHFEFGNHILF